MGERFSRLCLSTLQRRPNFLWSSLKLSLFEQWSLKLECVNSCGNSNFKSPLNNSSPRLCGLTKIHHVQCCLWASNVGWGWSGLLGLCSLAGATGAETQKPQGDLVLTLCLENWGTDLFVEQKRGRTARKYTLAACNLSKALPDMWGMYLLSLQLIKTKVLGTGSTDHNNWQNAKIWEVVSCAIELT